MQSRIEAESLHIFNEFLKDREDSYITSGARDGLPKFLKDIQTNGEPNASAFIALKIELLNWTKRYNLDRDWLLKYAYDFIRQFSINPDLKVSEIEVGYFQERSLAAFPFEFKFNGWLAGDEDKEDYQKRLTESFQTALENYFQSVGHQFNLEEIKKSTKPRDYDRVKWLVRWTVQKWSKDQILEESSLENDGEKFYDVRTIELAFQQFKDYNLPVRS